MPGPDTWAKFPPSRRRLIQTGRRREIFTEEVGVEWLELIRDLAVLLYWLTSLKQDFIEDFQHRKQKITDGDKGDCDRADVQKAIRNLLFIWYFTWLSAQK